MLSVLKKYNQIRTNKTIFNGFIFTVFSFMGTGVNFILLLVLSKFLSPSEYGYLNLFNTFITLMTIFVSINMEKIIVINYFKVNKLYTGETITGILIISIILALLYCLVILLFNNQLEAELGFSSIFLCIAIGYCLLNLLSNMNLAIWKAEANPKLYGIYSFSICFFNFAITVLFLVFFDLGWISRAMAQFGVSLLFGLLSVIIMYKRGFIGGNIRIRLHNMKEALVFGIPLIPNTLSWWAMQGINRFLINSYYGPAEVGLYSFATNFSNIIQIIATSFVQSWHVDVYERLTKKEEGYIEYLSGFTRKMICVYFAITICMYVLSIMFIPIIFPKYTDSLKFLAPLCIGAFAHCINQLFVCYLLYYKKTNILMNITIIVSAINVGLGFVLIQYNLLMAAYINMISESLIAIMYIIKSRRLVALKFI